MAHSSGGFNYDLLRKVEAIVSNYWEHGIEVTSTVMDIETLKSLSRQVSERLGVPVEIN